MQVLSLEAILPSERDVEPTGKFVDGRFRPSFVDLGCLQNLACRLAVPWKGQLSEDGEYPSRYVADVRVMVTRYVRHVEDITVTGNVVTFVAKDRWSQFAYSFELNPLWF